MEIDKNNILKYLGYQEQVLTTDLQAELDDAISEIFVAYKPKKVWKSMARKQLQHILIGKDINTHLGNAKQVILMAATLGQEVDFILRRSQSIDIKKAVILDATASVVIEAYLDQEEEILRNKFLEQDQYLSTRFSPGYGDLPLTVQEDFLNILNANRQIGVHVTKHGLMSPMKSVTCIMAISSKPVSKGKSPCSICRFRGNCPLRRRGGYCGKFSQEDNNSQRIQSEKIV